jgi:hypothetical protein
MAKKILSVDSKSAKLPMITSLYELRIDGSWTSGRITIVPFINKTKLKYTTGLLVHF